MFPSLEQYIELAAKYDLIPVHTEILADRETPVSVLERFVDSENVFLLESMEGGEKWGRYSFIGIEPQLIVDADHADGKTGELEQLRRAYRDIRVAPVSGLPRFFGGVVGYLGYEGVGEFEQMPLPKKCEQAPIPRSRFLQADRMIVFDNVRHTAKIVVSSRPAEFASPEAAYKAACADIKEISDRLRQPPARPLDQSGSLGEFSANMTREDFHNMVTRAKDYIYRGDIIQAVLSQRFTAKTDLHPFPLYRALRLLNPSPYMFFLKIGEQVLVGSSPEVMVRLTGTDLELRPIAGTRPRGHTEQEDSALADQLLSDEKEKAEHVMLVDLGRNDLGRVAESGSVQVRDYMVIERYSHVMHLVSHVKAIMRKEFDAYDVLSASFPAGTLSGAPKIRAMEIIHELEPQPRGAYGGAVGYIGYDGNMDFAITIRTLEISNGTVAVQAGAGIVYDSDPQTEFEETCHKARGMLEAVRMAANGLQIEPSVDSPETEGQA